MEYDQIIFLFGIFTLMGWYANAITVKKIIKEVGYHKDYYPKKYIMPNRRIGKIYHLKKREIPKWTYIHLFVAFVYIILFVISVLLILITENSPIVAFVFLVIYSVLICVDVVHLFIYCLLYHV